MSKSKVFYIIDSNNIIKDLSREYHSRSEAYNDLIKLHKLFGTMRFYIIERYL